MGHKKGNGGNDDWAQTLWTQTRESWQFFEIVFDWLPSKYLAD